MKAAGLVDDTQALETLITLGQRRMPGFGEACAPRGQCTFGPRLSADDIAAVTAYVQAQLAAGWN